MSCPIHFNGGCDCALKTLRQKETFYTNDSLTGQDLRAVKLIRPTQIDILTSDAKTSGKIHDHNFIDLKNKKDGIVWRGQQKLFND